MLNSVIEGCVVAAFGWLLLRLLGNQNSGTRFAVWFSALLSIPAFPFFFTSGSATAYVGASCVGVILPSFVGTFLFGTWLFIALVLLARLGVSLRHVRSLRRDARALDLTALDPALNGVLRGLNSSRHVALCVSDRVRVPAAVGFFQPAVIIPEWAMRELTSEDLKAVLLHELAHLQRWDDWTNLAQKVLKALFFFHPAVWWIERRLTLEREMACDDMVLAHTENPHAYASSLLSFAERVSGTRGLALTQAVVGRVRQISLRITQILNVDRPKSTRVWKPIIALLGTASTLAIFAAPYTPGLIAFENQVSAQALSQSSSQPVSVAPSFRAEQIQAKYAVPAAKEQVKTIPASVRAARNRVPKAIQVAAESRAVQAPDVLLVVQSVQYDMSGTAVWTTCVWRMSQAGEFQQQMQRTVVMNKL
jgi:beta-lactamase regulating signal transducer with metallopeptidase domain